MLQYLILIPCAVLIGAYGTLIGAGGGFLLVPLLLFLYPHESPELITGISLSVVFVGAVAGSFAYRRKRRIDYRSGLLLAIPTIPGAVLGAYTTFYTSRESFDAIFGIVLIALALYLIVKRDYRANKTAGAGGKSGSTTLRGREFPFNWKLGVSTSFAVGYLASLFGIGGGSIQVPIMVRLLNFPVKIATATSLFIIVLRSLAGMLTHLHSGSLSVGLPRIVCLAAGVYAGAYIGAHISEKIRSKWILRALAVALVIVGLRILAGSLFGNCLSSLSFAE